MPHEEHPGIRFRKVQSTLHPRAQQITRSRSAQPVYDKLGPWVGVGDELADAFIGKMDERKRSAIMRALLGSDNSFEFDPSKTPSSSTGPIDVDIGSLGTDANKSLGPWTELPTPAHLIDPTVGWDASGLNETDPSMINALIGVPPSIEAREANLLSRDGQAAFISQETEHANRHSPEARLKRLQELPENLHDHPLFVKLTEQIIATQHKEQALQAQSDTDRAYAAQLLEEEREWEIELERIKAGLGKEGAGHLWGTALQYTNRMTELRAQIAAIPDENSPERIVLQQELDDLLYNVARDPYALGEVSRHKARGTGRGTTAAGLEGDMRGIRDGISIKHDRLPLLQNTTNQIKKLAEGFFTSGLTGSIAAINPSSDQYQMNKLIKNIHSAIGLEELIAVKARGATFGALSDTEMELLIASIQSLDPLLPADTLKSNLDDVMRLYEKGLNTSKQNFREVYGEDERRPWEPPPGSGITQQEWDAMSVEEKRVF